MIPCCLTISCNDVTALNLFANPRTPRVRLRRLNRFLQNQAERPSDHEFTPLYSSPTISGVTATFAKLSDTPAQLTKRKSVNRARANHSKGGSSGATIHPFIPTPDGLDHTEDGLGSSDEETELDVGDGAVWCTPPTYLQEPGRRMLYGELHLPTGLQPTCRFPLFNILVSLSVHQI